MFSGLGQLRREGKHLGLFFVIKYITIHSYQSMPIIKIVLQFLYSSMKIFFRKLRLIFDIENDFENQNCDIFDLPFQIDPNT